MSDKGMPQVVEYELAHFSLMFSVAQGVRLTPFR